MYTGQVSYPTVGTESKEQCVMETSSFSGIY